MARKITDLPQSTLSATDLGAASIPVSNVGSNASVLERVLARDFMSLLGGSYRGTWSASPSRPYNFGDIVTVLSIITPIYYVCLIAGTTSNPSANTGWQLINSVVRGTDAGPPTVGVDGQLIIQDGLLYFNSNGARIPLLRGDAPLLSNQIAREPGTINILDDPTFASGSTWTVVGFNRVASTNDFGNGFAYQTSGTGSFSLKSKMTIPYTSGEQQYVRYFITKTADFAGTISLTYIKANKDGSNASAQTAATINPTTLNTFSFGLDTNFSNFGSGNITAFGVEATVTAGSITVLRLEYYKPLNLRYLPTTTSTSVFYYGNSTLLTPPDTLINASKPTDMGSLSGNITLNFYAYRSANFTLTGNSTLVNPSGVAFSGFGGRIRITQDPANSGAPYTLAYGSAWKFPGGAPTLSTTPGAVDLLVYFVNTDLTFECTLVKDVK
jgi:hypothetical protein